MEDNTLPPPAPPARLILYMIDNRGPMSACNMELRENKYSHIHTQISMDN